MENKRKLEQEELSDVTGGLSQERQEYLDGLIAICKKTNRPIDTALKGCNNLEEIVYVKNHW
jgi:hypothetical protein